jgi:hypothetical protein
MKPNSSPTNRQHDLFRIRLDALVNPGHRLCRLVRLIDRELLEREISPHFSAQGSPALPVRLMEGLIYLQHA